MPGSIETITDTNRFEDIFNKEFPQGDVFLKTKNGNFKVSYAGFSEGLLALKIPLLKSMPPQCIVFMRKPGETVYAQLQFYQKEEEELYLFHTMKMQIISAIRSEERESVTEGGKSLLFVSNVLSGTIIERTMALESRKVDLIKQTILNHLDQMFSYKKIFFINEGMSDIRMRHFYEKHAEYIIGDFNSIDKNNPAERYYLDNIYNKDYFLINRKQYISEAACAFTYKNAIPIGYLQVNHSVPMDTSALEIIRRLTSQSSKLFQQAGLFKALEENLLVSDISSKGLGIVFKERSYIRYFPEKSYVHFELKLPDQVRISMLTIVRNISFLENKIIKVGCEILEIDESSRKVYDHFLDQLMRQ